MRPSQSTRAQLTACAPPHSACRRAVGRPFPAPPARRLWAHCHRRPPLGSGPCLALECASCAAPGAVPRSVSGQLVPRHPCHPCHQPSRESPARPSRAPDSGAHPAAARTSRRAPRSGHAPARTVRSAAGSTDRSRRRSTRGQPAGRSPHKSRPRLPPRSSRTRRRRLGGNSSRSPHADRRSICPRPVSRAKPESKRRRPLAPVRTMPQRPASHRPLLGTTRFYVVDRHRGER